MNKIFAILVLALTGLILFSFQSADFNDEDELSIDSLRKVYSKPTDQWPKPTVDKDAVFQELGEIPPSPVDLKNDSTKKVVELGKILFFDPRLSGSNQISCSSCHAPDLHWTDGRQVSVGHDHLTNIRNAPSLENVWFYKRLFWDGRAASLEEQAGSPVAAHNEMHQDMKVLPKKLSKIKGYQPLFAAAFGSKEITNKRIFESLATFQRSIVSRRTPFDRFLAKDKKALTDQQLVGLHLFRTKARCINCHNGPFFTDNEFHNDGLTYYGRKYEDLGLYNVTKKPEDVGKFKTPGLRNVMKTAPWFHNGLFPDIDGVMNMYNVGMPVQRVKPEQLNDPLLPKNDKLLKGLKLSIAEKDAVVAFLEALSSPTVLTRVEQLPQ
ncbi:cytochrome-c peroxidase [Pedobacter psychrodurus]|uniref:Methylamine utilization protein MauG n=1 Tax=Pedobacter psychrodurus TaxID=2530456 RepID=A0A4R0PYV8_9SPHI|nr:cytochrome c peroxidase [Pedobacter psychrodurus]TCD26655.1 cytochrome-c peroxidase [Pedobacter psychrodurus]